MKTQFKYVLESLRPLRKCATFTEKKNGALGTGIDPKQRKAPQCHFRRLFRIY